MRLITYLATFMLLSISPRASESAVQELTEDYLAGPWCLSHTMAGKDRQDEMTNYIFEKGGTFLHQGSSHSDKMTPGLKYQILPGKIKLKPIYPGDLKVKSVEKDELVLNYFVDLYFTRGACE